MAFDSINEVKWGEPSWNLEVLYNELIDEWFREKSMAGAGVFNTIERGNVRNSDSNWKFNQCAIQYSSYHNIIKLELCTIEVQ